MIVRWRGTIWDLGSYPSYHDPEEEAEMTSLVLSTEGFRLLKTVTTLDPDVARMIAAARLTENGVELSGRIEELRGTGRLRRLRGEPREEPASAAGAGLDL